ncbi:MAG: hypothetical protein LBD16_05580 [Oscillospiraceae bacterium]|nr:hypothetical protein [Oscillospiraceae bacterium]
MILSNAGCNTCRPMFVPGYPCGPYGGPGYPGVPGFCGDHHAGCCGGYGHGGHGHGCGHGHGHGYGHGHGHCGCQNPAYMNSAFSCGPGCVGGYSNFAVSC